MPIDFCLKRGYTCLSKFLLLTNTIMNKEDRKAWVLDYLRKESGVKEVTESDCLKNDLGIDSLDACGLAVHAEDALGISVSNKKIKNWITVADVLRDYQAA